MKKLRKMWVLSGLTLVTIGIVGMINNGSETLLKSNVSSYVQAYNHNPNNIVDNVFEKDGLTILPFIFKDSEQTISKQYVVDQFKKEGLIIQNEASLPSVIVTGTQIKTIPKTYTVLIYGDVNADGYVDVFDAQRILRHYVYGGNNTLTGINETAGNVNNQDNEVDVFDAQRILRFYVGFETKLVINEPTSIKETDSQAPVITLKGNNPQTIKLGEKYIEAGAIVTDNVDKNLVAVIDASKVNTNQVGTYSVIYTAVDKSGNKATQVRTVHVIDYVTELIVTPPTKTQYQYGENLNTAGMIVKANMKSGNTVTLESSKYQISGYNQNKIGEQTIHVSYDGKTASFVVKVNDYQIGITVQAPEKTTYLYNEELNLIGATVTDMMASGAKGEEIAVTTDMISGYDKEVLGNQTILVSYHGYTANFVVTVNDYAKDIQITKMPSKLIYKYGEELDLTDMIVEVEMAKEGLKEITDYEIVGYDKEKLGNQTITIKYAGKETTLAVTVENYVVDIEIEVLPTKLDYIEGEMVNLSDMVVNKVMKDGTKETIALDDPNLTTVPNTNITFGDTQIKVIYTTNDTINNAYVAFERTYSINVLKKLSSIEVKTEITNGYAHESFIFATIASGENQVEIKKDQLKVQVIKDGVEVTEDIEVTYTELGIVFDNQIQVKLKIEQIGNYELIFYVGENIDSENVVTSETQTIEITNNPIVDNASITIDPMDKIRVGSFIEKDIIFTNKHGDLLNEVQAGTIELLGENIELTKLNGDVPVEGSNRAVNKIRIKGKTAGETTIVVKVNKGTENEKSIILGSYTILDKAKKEINIGDMNSLTLYQEEPLTPKESVVVYNDDVYTLIPIYIEDEDGNITKIKGTDITMGQVTDNKKLGISYSDYDPMDPFIQVQLFNGINPVMSAEEADSVGIALIYGVGPDKMNGKELKIEYKGCETIKTLPIHVQDLKISELVITSENKDELTGLPTGYNHEKFVIGSIRSGEKQKEITIDDLYTNRNANYRVKNALGQDITNQIETNGKKTVEVSYEYDNLRQEMLIYAMTQKQGEYIIECFVNVGEETVAKEQTIETIHDPKVTNVQIIDLGSLTVGKPVQKQIQFINQYGDKLEIDMQDVEIIANGVNVTLVNKDGEPSGIVDKVELTATSKEKASLTLKVGEKTLPNIVFTITQANIKIDIGGTTEISLYETDPSLANVKVVNGMIYTLIPIHINQDGVTKYVKGNEIILKNPSIERPVTISYTDYDYLDPYIDIKMFKNDEIVEDSQEAQYLGIALFYIEASQMSGKNITIEYPDAEPINIVVK